MPSEAYSHLNKFTGLERAAIRLGFFQVFNSRNTPEDIALEVYTLTLEWCRGGLSHVEILLTDTIDWLVLGNLHTCTYIAFSMKEECEGAG